jgi:uncharacterized membrane protein YhaH (DUF805 family)
LTSHGAHSLPDRSQLIWLFFRLPGRVNRTAYFLGVLLLVIIQLFLVYRLMLVEPTSAAAQFWAAAFWLSVPVAVWSNVALSVKRLHDMGKPGTWVVTLFIPVVSIIAFVFICLSPGNPGPNQYGQRTNEPG